VEQANGDVILRMRWLADDRCPMRARLLLWVGLAAWLASGCDDARPPLPSYTPEDAIIDRFPLSVKTGVGADGEQVARFATSFAGDSFAGAGESPQILLLRLEKGRILQSKKVGLPANGGRCTAISYSRNGRELAIAQKGVDGHPMLSILDVQSGQVERHATVNIEVPWIPRLWFDQSNKLLAGELPREIAFWKTDDLSVSSISKLPDGYYPMGDLAWPNGECKMLLAQGAKAIDLGVYVLDRKSGRITRRTLLDLTNFIAYRSEFAPDGRSVIAIGETADGAGQMRVYNANTGKQTVSFNAHSAGARKFGTEFAISPSGKEVVVPIVTSPHSLVGAVVICDIVSGKVLQSLSGFRDDPGLRFLAEDTGLMVDQFNVVTWDVFYQSQRTNPK
jgi:hypothetical protein